MNAPSVLLALVEAGVVLRVEAGHLRFRAPVGALDPPLGALAAACRSALVALVQAGAVLPASLADWPENARENAEERAGIMQFEGGLTRDMAEREAERCVRLEHVRAWLDRAAMRSSP